MNRFDANDLVSSKFRYVTDSEQYHFREVWRVLNTKKEVWNGDCEDYALTVMWLMSDQNVYKFLFNLFINPKFSIWFVHTERGVGHAILEHDGFFVDNIQRKWFIRTDTEYKKYDWKFKVYPPMILGKLFVSAPFLFWSIVNETYRK